MELKEAINIINNFRTWYMGGDISNDVLQEIYKSIDTVLEELNNRIPIKEIQEILDYQYDLWNTPNKQKEFNLELVETLENLLEGVNIYE